MKFKFINKAKDLNPADISAQMNFAKVAQSAKALSFAKLSAGVLKLGTSTITTVVTSTAVVVTATVIGVTNPTLFENRNQQEISSVEDIFETEKTQQEPFFSVDKTVPEPQESVAAQAETKPVEEPSTQETIPETSPIQEQEALTDQVEFHSAEEENIFIQPRVLPSLEVFYNYIDQELTYPEEFLEDPIKGNVEIRFTVNTEGKAVNFKVKKSLGEVFDDEAIRVLQKYPNWQPASLNGQAVAYNMEISIRFETK